MRRLLALWMSFYSILFFTGPQVFAETCPSATETEIGAPYFSLQISSVYAKPLSGESEWVTISNKGTQNINLNAYTLEDATAHPWSISGEIAAGSDLVIQGFPFKLNDSGDHLILRFSDGTLIDEWNFGASLSGEILDRNALEIEESEEGEEENTDDSTNSDKYPIFSEVFPNPEGSDEESEWVELYNPWDESIHLDGFYLDDEDGGSRPFALSGELGANDYLLIPITESKLSFKNSSEVVRLLDSSKEVIWEIEYVDAKEAQSYARFDEEFAWTGNPSPEEENIWSPSELSDSSANGNSASSGTDTTYQNGDLSSSVELTEVFPNPEGSDSAEWIEITNGGSESVNLGNWTIDDGEGGSDPYVIPDHVILNPGETLIIERSESGISLNNSNESVRLFNFKQELVDEVTYESSKENVSYSKILIEPLSTPQAGTGLNFDHGDVVWEWSDPSPGQKNPIWKEFEGKVEHFDGSTVSMSDAYSDWQFKTSEDSSNEMLFRPGNEVLVRLARSGDDYLIKSSQLISSSPGGVESENLIPSWILLLPLAAIGLWLGYKHHKKDPKFEISQE